VTKLQLTSMISDHAVLQQGKPVRVWGKAAPGANVHVTLAGDESNSQTDENGNWFCELNASTETGEHELKVSDGETEIIRRDLRFGDVWLCSGQSNMQWPLSLVANHLEEIEKADSISNTYLYFVPKDHKEEPVHSIDAEWKVCSSYSAKNFSALSIFFAQELRKFESCRDVPIGLIDSSYGGTMIEAWMRRDFLQSQFKDEKLQESMFGIKPSSMFNGMIGPLVPFSIKGVLWYQGESNSEQPKVYRKFLEGMIDHWRGLWNDPELPFLIVQLPNFEKPIGKSYFTGIREVQQLASDAKDRCWLIPTYDQGDPFDLHPPDKRYIGQRLALKAAGKIYGESVDCENPRITSWEVDKDTAILKVEGTYQGLRSPINDAPSGFQLQNGDGRFLNASAKLESDAIHVSHPEIDRIQNVRYAWKGSPDGNVYNSAGLPLLPWRSDNEDFAVSEIEREPHRRVFKTNHYRIIIDGWGRIVDLRLNHLILSDQSNELLPTFHLYNWSGVVEYPQIHELGNFGAQAKGPFGTIDYWFEESEIKITINHIDEVETSLAKLVLKKRHQSRDELVLKTYEKQTEFSCPGIAISVDGFENVSKEHQHYHVLEKELKPKSSYQFSLKINNK